VRLNQTRVAVGLSIIAATLVMILGGGATSGLNLAVGIVVGIAMFILIANVNRRADEKATRETLSGQDRASASQVSRPPTPVPEAPTTVAASEILGSVVAAREGRIPRLYDRSRSAKARLYEAGQYGDVAAAELAIADGAPVSGFTRDHEFAALWPACFFGSADVARVLLEHGADPNGFVGIKKKKALPFAAFNEHPEVVRVLIEHGADPNQTNKQRQTALHMAAMRGNREIVEMMLKAGANPNLTDKTEWTPLKLAAHYGYGEVAALLIEHGAQA